MVKFIRRTLKADDPLFTGRPQVFAPISRPSTAKGKAGPPVGIKSEGGVSQSGLKRVKPQQSEEV